MLCQGPELWPCRVTGTIVSRATSEEAGRGRASRMLLGGQLIATSHGVRVPMPTWPGEVSELFVRCEDIGARDAGLGGYATGDRRDRRPFNLEHAQGDDLDRMGQDEAPQAQIEAAEEGGGCADEDEHWGEDVLGRRCHPDPGTKRLAAIQASWRVWRRRNGRDGARSSRTAIDRAGAATSGSTAVSSLAARGRHFRPRAEGQIMKTSSEGFLAVLQRADGAFDGRLSRSSSRLRYGHWATGNWWGARRDQRNVCGRTRGRRNRCGLLQRDGSARSWRTAASTRTSPGVADLASPRVAVDLDGDLPRTGLGEKLARGARARPGTRNASGSRRRRTVDQG